MSDEAPYGTAHHGDDYDDYDAGAPDRWADQAEGWDEDWDEHWDEHWEDAGWDDHPAGRSAARPLPDGYDDGGWPEISTPPPRRRAARRGPAARPAGRSRGGLRGHPVLATLAVIVVVIVVLVGAGIVWARSQIDPGGKPGPAVTVVITPGSSTRQIGSVLASRGVIHNGTLFAYYVRLHGDGPLLAGTYSLARNEPYSAAIAALEKGPVVVTETLVIPEGFTVRQIAQRVAALPGFGLSAKKFVDAANSGAVRSPYEPPGVNDLEGLLFPATYRVTKGETEVKILEQMVGEFNNQASVLGLDSAAQSLGLTPYQVVTVASIVEKEAKLAPDRGPVASTIYNRLKIHMHLGADSTQTYWLRLSDPTLAEPTAAQDDEPSPYNTRLNAGLPPTPIANPGLAALRAAVSPPTTTYLYFVEINPDGQLGFAATTSGFDALQQQCRQAHLC